MNVRSLVLAATLTCFTGACFAQSENPVDKMKKDATKMAVDAKKGAKDAVKKAVQPEGADAMAEWKKFNMPSKEHLTLQKNMVGEWNAVSTFWAAPDTEAMTFNGTAHFSSAMGGRFVMQEHAGEIMGEKFKGLGFFGYNNGAGRFESFWIDNESTLMLMSQGTQQSDGSIEWKGTYVDPMNGAERISRSVTRFNADGTMTYEMFENGVNGQEFKALEVKYTRSSTSATVITTDAVPTTITDPHANSPAKDGQKTPGN